MRYLAIVLSLLALFLVSSSASADDKTGLTFYFEYRNLELSGGDEDDLTILGPAMGYTADFDGWYGQIGFRVDHFMLDRPSVEGVVFTEGCPTPPDHPFPESQEHYTLDPEFTYWGVGPMFGARIPIIEEWIGVNLLASALFPVTNDSSGWGMEVGAFAQYTFMGLIGLDLVVGVGGKFIHVDHEADRTLLLENRMMPAFIAALYL